MIKNHRFIVIAVIFILLCSSFLIVLAINQAKGPSRDITDLSYDIRTEIVYGERGRIFDRNGVLLVDNTKKYDLIFEYGSMAYTSDGMNGALLDCLDILAATGNESKRAKDYFVLVGSYPELSLSPDAYNTDTNIGFYYNRYIIENELKPDITAEELVKYMMKDYKLSEKKYNAAEITALLRIRYDMDRIGFGAYAEYTIAKGFETSVHNEMELITLINEKSVEGANMYRQTGRVYLYEGYASHILGKLGKITAENIGNYEGYPADAYVGISGCEYAFEKYLRGEDGRRVSKYDRNGKLIEEYYDPAPTVGNDVYLTIDINMQIAAEDSLAEEIDELEYSEAGAATAIDTTTGEVLVIASYPTYETSQLNRALYGLYAPGSTYKIGSALAGLEEGSITASSTSNCQHVYPYYHNPTCLGTHGVISVAEAIEVSCNIFFYELGDALGIDKISEYTKALGLGVPTGIELGEAVGSIASTAYCEDKNITFTAVNNATGAIGQSYHTYTPLQLSVYMSAIVNHGERYSAHLLKTVMSRKGEVVYAKKPEIVETLNFSNSTYDTLMEGMGLVVSESAELSSYFSSIDVDVGGKTGTAETGKHDNALFSGFAPFDEPKIVASCVIEYGEAGKNAAKVVADIFDAYFNAPDEELE